MWNKNENKYEMKIIACIARLVFLFITLCHFPRKKKMEICTFEAIDVCFTF